MSKTRWKQRGQRLTALCMLVIFVLSMTAVTQAAQETKTAAGKNRIYLFSGYYEGKKTVGDMILVESDGHYGLIDTLLAEEVGTERERGIKWAKWMIKRLGVTHLDFILGTHGHTDHIGGVVDIAKQTTLVDENTVFLHKYVGYAGMKNARDAMAEKGAQLVELSGGLSTAAVQQGSVPQNSRDNVKALQKVFGGTVSFDAGESRNAYDDYLEFRMGDYRIRLYHLYFAEHQENEQANENSVVTLIHSVSTGKDMVFLGDLNDQDYIGEKIAAEISKDLNNQRLDVVKDAHHGAKAGSNTLAEAKYYRPRIDVTSVAYGEKINEKKNHIELINNFANYKYFCEKNYQTKFYASGDAEAALRLDIGEKITVMQVKENGETTAMPENSRKAQDGWHIWDYGRTYEEKTAGGEVKYYFKDGRPLTGGWYFRNGVPISQTTGASTDEYHYFETDGSLMDVETPQIQEIKNGVSGVELVWSGSNGAEWYRVYRKTQAGSWTVLKRIAGTEYIDTSAVSGTTYSYAVRCVTPNDHTFLSRLSDGRSITYIAMPKLESVTEKNQALTLKWKAVKGAKTYQVMRKIGSEPWKGIGQTKQTTYTDTTAVPGVTYAYTVRILDRTGKVAGEYDKKGLTGMVTAAKTSKSMSKQTPILTSITNNTSGVRITWGMVPSISRYRIYRKTGNDTWTVIGTSSDTSYIDKTAKGNTTYTYTVAGVTADGKQKVTDYDHTGLTTTFIAAPVLKEILPTSDGSGITIKWNASDGASVYRIYRKAGVNAAWTTYDTVEGKTEYTDRKALGGITYSYTVRCMSEDGKSYISGNNNKGLTLAFASVPKLVDTKNTEDGVQIEWRKTSGAVRYRVYRKTKGTAYQVIGETDETVFTDPDSKIKSGKTYTYTVRCIDKNGAHTGGYDKDGKERTYLQTPKLQNAKVTNAGTQVTWKRSDGAEKYEIYRRIGTHAPTKIGTVSAKDSLYQDKTTTKATGEKVYKQYRYYVKAVSKGEKTEYQEKGLQPKAN